MEDTDVKHLFGPGGGGRKQSDDAMSIDEDDRDDAQNGVQVVMKGIIGSATGYSWSSVCFIKWLMLSETCICVLGCC